MVMLSIVPPVSSIVGNDPLKVKPVPSTMNLTSASLEGLDRIPRGALHFLKHQVLGSKGNHPTPLHREEQVDGVVALMVGGVGGWAAATDVAGAVIAQGIVVVESNVRKVQHPTGGVVGEIRARDGDRVKVGDILVRLDETITRTNLAIVTRAVDEFAARKARLEAERNGAEKVTFPDDLLQRANDRDVGPRGKGRPTRNRSAPVGL